MDRRNTVQKELVLKAVQSLGSHATADEIYQEIIQSHPSISKGTVYRNLSILAEEGKILRLEIPGDADHYDHFTQEHYHIHCIKCHRLFDTDLSLPNDLLSQIKDTRGFSILGFDFVIKGVCPDCLKNNSTQS